MISHIQKRRAKRGRGVNKAKSAVVCITQRGKHLMWNLFENKLKFNIYKAGEILCELLDISTIFKIQLSFIICTKCGLVEGGGSLICDDIKNTLLLL